MMGHKGHHIGQLGRLQAGLIFNWSLQGANHLESQTGRQDCSPLLPSISRPFPAVGPGTCQPQRVLPNA